MLPQLKLLHHLTMAHLLRPVLLLEVTVPPPRVHMVPQLILQALFMALPLLQALTTAPPLLKLLPVTTLPHLLDVPADKGVDSITTITRGETTSGADDKIVS